MKGALHAAAALAAIALTLFWAAVTAGRLLFASIEPWFPSRHTLRLLPCVIGASFIATALVPSSSPHLGAAAFAVAGLGCSALLPLAISLGGHDAPPGKVIASYQIGFGLAAFGIAPMHDRLGLSLRVLFGGAAVIAAGLAALAVVIVRGSSVPAKKASRS
jgi:MFS family permease